MPSLWDEIWNLSFTRDRNKPCYGSGKEYDDYYLAQLTELLTGYGDIFSVWLDGACVSRPQMEKTDI